MKATRLQEQARPGRGGIAALLAAVLALQGCDKIADAIFDFALAMLIHVTIWSVLMTVGFIFVLLNVVVDQTRFARVAGGLTGLACMTHPGVIVALYSEVVLDSWTLLALLALEALTGVVAVFTAIRRAPPRARPSRPDPHTFR